MKKIYYALFCLPFFAKAQIDWNKKDTLQQSSPSGWNTSNPSSLSMTGHASVIPAAGFENRGVHINNCMKGTDTVIGFISNSSGDFLSGKGGVPFSQRPTAITGFYRYHLQGADTALLIVIFKKDGHVISKDVFKIRGTGRQDFLVGFSYPLSLNAVPDTMIIAMSSGYLFKKSVAGASSFLEADQLAFTGNSAMKPIAGGTFDSWSEADRVLSGPRDVLLPGSIRMKNN